MNLVEIGQEREGGLVSQRNIDDAVVSQCAHTGKSSRFLATAGGAGGDENTSVFSPVATAAPNTAGFVPERFPLGGEVAISGWDSKEKSVVLEKLIGVTQDLNAGVLGSSMHFGEDILW